MKATGEVMSICTSFEGGSDEGHPFPGAARGLPACPMTIHGLTDEELKEQLNRVDDRRIWVIAEALRRGILL